MTELGASCPTSLQQINTHAKLCGRRAPGCSSVTYPVDGVCVCHLCVCCVCSMCVCVCVCACMCVFGLQVTKRLLDDVSACSQYMPDGASGLQSTMSLQLIAGVCDSLPSVGEQWDSLSALACLSIHSVRDSCSSSLVSSFTFLANRVSSYCDCTEASMRAHTHTHTYTHTVILGFSVPRAPNLISESSQKEGHNILLSLLPLHLHLPLLPQTFLLLPTCICHSFKGPRLPHSPLSVPVPTPTCMYMSGSQQMANSSSSVCISHMHSTIHCLVAFPHSYKHTHLS